MLAIFIAGCSKEESLIADGDFNYDIEEPLSARITEIEFQKSLFSNVSKRRIILENDSIAKALFSKITLIMEDNRIVEFEPQYLNGEIVRLINKSESNSDIEISYTYNTSKNKKMITKVKSFSNFFPFALDLSYTGPYLQDLDISQLNPITKQHSTNQGPWLTKFCPSELEDNCTEGDLVKYQTTHYENPFYSSNNWLVILMVLNYNTNISYENGVEYRSEGFSWTVPFYTKKNLPYSINEENYKYSYDIAFQNKNRLDAVYYTPLGSSVEYLPTYSILFKYRNNNY